MACEDEVGCFERLAAEPCVPGPSGWSEKRGKRKRMRLPCPTSDLSSSDADTACKLAARDYYYPSDNSCLSDSGIPWGLGGAEGSWSLPSSYEDEREINGKYHEYPKLFSRDNDYESAATIMYRMGFVTGYPTSIITDSEDDYQFLIEGSHMASEHFTLGWNHEGPVLTITEDDQADQDSDEAESMQMFAGDSDSVTTDDIAIESDDGFEAGDEDDGDDINESDIDPETPEEDLWHCSSCQRANHPMTRRCLKCWKLHPDYMPVFEMQRTTSDKSTDSGISTCDDGNEPIITLSTTDSTLRDSRLQENELCLICVAEPRNASMIHPPTGHQVCCYRCAKKLKRLRQPCPICRKKIKMVVKNIM